MRHPSSSLIPLREDRRRLPSRRGFGTIELLVSMILFGVLVSSIGPVVRRISDSNRLNKQRQLAQFELANLMEQIATLPPEEMTAKSVESLRTVAIRSSQLEDVELTASISDQTEGLRQVSLSLVWKSPSGGMKPVSLTAWFLSDSPEPEDAA